MSRHPEALLADLLHDRNPDVCRVIDAFICRFNAVYGNPDAENWDISKEDWQRYEFLGDRVLNLIVAQILFTRREASLSEGEMTQVLSSVVSNQALDALCRRFNRAVFSRLIPKPISGQDSYGRRITGGAFEAFIGALYCEFGLDDVTFFVTAVIADLITDHNPRENAIGLLQEFFQKRGEPLPVYSETSRTGPDHELFFTVRVRVAGGESFEGSGLSLAEARKTAAQKALDSIGADDRMSGQDTGFR